MAAGEILNCKKCNKIFQRRLGDVCSDCVQMEEQHFKIIYRALQKHASTGGVSLIALSEQTGISQDIIEVMYLEGRLTTAGAYLKMPCQGCARLTSEKERRGRYCFACSESTANQAGVEVKSIQMLQREEEERLRRQEQLKILKRPAATALESKAPHHYGFTNRAK